MLGMGRPRSTSATRQNWIFALSCRFYTIAWRCLSIIFRLGTSSLMTDRFIPPQPVSFHKTVTLCLEPLATRDHPHPMKGHPGHQDDHADYGRISVSGCSMRSLRGTGLRPVSGLGILPGLAALPPSPRLRHGPEARATSKPKTEMCPANTCGRGIR